MKTRFKGQINAEIIRTRALLDAAKLREDWREFDRLSLVLELLLEEKIFVLQGTPPHIARMKVRC